MNNENISSACLLQKWKIANENKSSLLDLIVVVVVVMVVVG